MVPLILGPVSFSFADFNTRVSMRLSAPVTLLGILLLSVAIWQFGKRMLSSILCLECLHSGFMIGRYYQYIRMSSYLEQEENLENSFWLWVMTSDDKGQVEVEVEFEYNLVKGSVKCLYNPFIPTNTDYISPDKYWILNKY